MHTASTYSIHEAYSPADIAAVKELFILSATELKVPLDHQNFPIELNNLPGSYSPPEARLYILKYETEPAGCIALRKINTEICELKRLFVKTHFRGKGLGKLLTQKAVSSAKEIGYKSIKLSSDILRMKNAIEIYKAIGFKEIMSYYDDPEQNAIYMELIL